jgi:hypothetical protein
MQYKCKITILLIALSLAAFGQRDTSNNNMKGKVFISGGIGASTILWNIYGLENGQTQNDGIIKAQSIVYNGAIDYGFFNFITIGAGVAYQTANGVFETGNVHYTENFSRLNLSLRLLNRTPLTDHFELYGGFRVGASYWTDIITPVPGPTSSGALTLNGNHVAKFPSLQALIGFNFFIGHIGINLEAALGTPYFIEGGLTIRF